MLFPAPRCCRCCCWCLAICRLPPPCGSLPSPLPGKTRAWCRKQAVLGQTDSQQQRGAGGLGFGTAVVLPSFYVLFFVKTMTKYRIIGGPLFYGVFMTVPSGRQARNYSIIAITRARVGVVSGIGFPSWISLRALAELTVSRGAGI